MYCVVARVQSSTWAHECMYTHSLPNLAYGCMQLLKKMSEYMYCNSACTYDQFDLELYSSCQP